MSQYIHIDDEITEDEGILMSDLKPSSNDILKI